MRIRDLTMFVAPAVMLALFASVAGCDCQKKKPAEPPADTTAVDDESADDVVTGGVDQPSDAGTVEAKPAKPLDVVGEVKRMKFTAEDNPTTAAGRGEPQLTDKSEETEGHKHAAAWIYIDGHPGEYRGDLLQWFTVEKVRPCPTFRVEVYEPLLGTPKNFNGALQMEADAEGNKPETPVIFGIAADDGTFEVGRVYDLCKPGDNFTVRNVNTNEVVDDMGSLPPGTYGLITGIKNAETNVEALAATYFTIQGAKAKKVPAPDDGKKTKKVPAPDDGEKNGADPGGG